MDERLCLLTVHAHPDDEASKGPGTVARYHAEGVRTVLVTCTGGEEGDILNPAMDTPEVRADLAAVRARELETAARIIGYDEVELLGYRDSGMPGSEANQRPDAFGSVPLEEAVGKLVAIVRRVRPQVIIGYGDDHSGYPHPDHIRAHEIAVAAFEAAGDPGRFEEAGPPYQPLKLYYTVWSRKRIVESHQKFLELGLESPFDARWFERPDHEDEITTSIDLSGYEDVRRDALLAHATQIDPTSRYWFGLPPEVARTIHP
ncbi:MAG TPA: PIG-L family deacetylase, partial [Acidimicrobiales bacterium]|nr:PIG-L family deacetylase [Acidimicrobiales bacterium]